MRQKSLPPGFDTDPSPFYSPPGETRSEARTDRQVRRAQGHVRADQRATLLRGGAHPRSRRGPSIRRWRATSPTRSRATASGCGPRWRCSPAARPGNIGPSHFDLAVVVELIHAATLVHDDILDGADKRRGQPTANAKWGNAISRAARRLPFRPRAEAFHQLSEWRDRPPHRARRERCLLAARSSRRSAAST